MVQIKRWAAERPGWAITSLYMTASNFSSAPTGASTITRFLKPRAGSPLPATSAPGQQPTIVRSPTPSMSGQPVQSASPHPRHSKEQSIAPSAAEQRPEELLIQRRQQALTANNASGDLVAAAALQQAPESARPSDVQPSLTASVAAEGVVSDGMKCSNYGESSGRNLGHGDGAQVDAAPVAGKQDQASCSMDASLLLQCAEEVCWETHPS